MISTLLDVRRLEEAIPKVLETATGLGLDPFPVHFEVVPAPILYEFGAYGLPGRFSHWTHGRAYQQLKTSYNYGLSKIYELVINTNPAYGFLLETNSVLQNVLVVAHVLAHVDFFKHNAYFAPTNRRMVDTASLNADRIRDYELRHGKTEVENFLDAVLSIQEHIDPHFHLRRAEDPSPDEKVHLISGPYDDLFPGDAARSGPAGPAVPEPERDILRYVVEHARHLTDWQRDVIEIIRQEQLYFVPQMRTKIMNEGWASYWHVRIMRELDLPHEDYLNFSQMHASILAPHGHQINPYHVGMKLFEEIERRWDEPTAEEQERFGRRPGEGRAKIFDVRAAESDASFLRNYLTADLVEDLDLYVYRLEGNQWIIVEKDWEKVRDTLVADLTNFGNPYIVVADGDYNGNGELFLRHLDEGKPLDTNYAERTLSYVQQLWGRAVHLETTVDGKTVVLTTTGESPAHPHPGKS
jgi:stage V sporulation protein R